MSEALAENGLWAELINTSDELLAVKGEKVSPSVSEMKWSEEGVEYTLRRVATSKQPDKPHGHIVCVYSLFSFNSAGAPNGKMVTYSAPDAYLSGGANEIAVGLGDEPPEVWAFGALAFAQGQLKNNGYN